MEKSSDSRELLLQCVSVRIIGSGKGQGPGSTKPERILCFIHISRAWCELTARLSAMLPANSDPA